MYQPGARIGMMAVCSTLALGASGLVGCGVERTAPSADNAVAVERSPIVNGIQLSEWAAQYWGLVGVFHPRGAFPTF